MILFNEEQQKAIESVEEGKNVFITGSPGTGKSFTLRFIIQSLRNSKRKFAITSSTGCSAILIRGQTINSYLCMGIGTLSSDNIVKNIKTKKRKFKELQELQILIIDEISMIDNNTLQKMSEILQKIKSVFDKEFGGIQVIFVGDFCQLSPVNGNYCFTSKVWDELRLTYIHLNKLIRQKDDIEFQKILLKVRFGKCSTKTFEKLNSLKDTTFENIVPTKLYSLNKDVDAINNYEYKRVYSNNTKIPMKNANIIQCFPPATETINEPNDSKYDMDCDVFRYNAISNDKYVKLDEYKIDLIKGLQVMVIRNIDIECGLVNGTLGKIIELTTTSVCIIDTNNNKHNISYHTDINENNKLNYIKFMPIKMAYALSIHKSQGATLDAIEVDGSSNIFAPGQLYTAISRAKNLKSIKLLNLDKQSFICNPYVKEFYEKINIENITS